MLARLSSGTDVLTVQSGVLQRASTSCGAAKGMRRERCASGTGTRVPPRLTSLLFLLSEELHRQPRAVYKYWAGGLLSCNHAATSSSSTSSSTSVSVHRQSVGHSCYVTETGIRSATVQVVGSVHSCFLADEVCGRARRRNRQVHVQSWFAGDHAFLAVLPSIGEGPRSSASWSVWTGHDFRHHGRYGPEGFVFGARSCIHLLLVRQWIQVRVLLRGSCISAPQSTELFCLLCNAWFDSGYICRVVVVLAVAWFLPVCWLR